MLKRFFELLSVLCLLAFLSAVVGVFLFHRYVQGPEFREMLTNGASNTLGTQVHLTGLRFNIFSGFDLAGVEIENPPPNNAERFLTIERLHLSYTPWRLLRHQFVIQEFDLVKPEVAIRFYSDGSSNLPVFKETVAAAPAIGLADLKLDVALDRFHLDGGGLAIWNADKELLFALRGANVDGNYLLGAKGAEAKGKIQIGEMLLGSKFKITDANASIGYADRKLVLPDVQGKAYGGVATGSVEANFNHGQPSFNMQMKLADADVPAIARDLGKNADWVTSKLSMTTQLEGSLLQPKLLTGHGDFEMKDMDLSKFKLFKDIAEILAAPELAMIKFASVKGTFKVGDQKITFFNVEGVSELVQMSGAGSVTFDRQVDFDVMLAISDKVKLPDAIAQQLTKRDDHFKTITFKVSGTLSDLRTNLDEKIARTAVSAIIEKYKDKVPENFKQKAREILNILDGSREQKLETVPPSAPQPTPESAPVAPPPPAAVPPPTEAAPAVEGTSSSEEPVSPEEEESPSDTGAPPAPNP